MRHFYEYDLLCNLTDGVTRFYAKHRRLGYLYSRCQAGENGLCRKAARMQLGSARSQLTLMVTIHAQAAGPCEGLPAIRCMLRDLTRADICNCCNSDIGLPEWQSLRWRLSAGTADETWRQ